MQHRSLSIALIYWRGYDKILGQIYNPYDKISRGSLARWFIPQGVLKEKLQQTTDKITTRLLKKNHLTIMEKHPQVHDGICDEIFMQNENL